MEGTAALRKAAPNWSLAGDKQLLDVLQNIHQSLMTRCQETNQRLEQMATALDDASVDLQNVNNKFMALSNSQFIESRVYDDDADILTSEPPKELPKPQEPVSELSMLKASVKLLQSMHEEIQIVDSDSESDSEEDVPRTVLKPKDFYRHRPLPYIIGSDAWKAKWHAGLIVEDSDSDSLVSKRDEDMDQYSDSEAESPAGPLRDDSVRDNQESTTSSEMPSYQEYPPISKPSQAEVAAEIARRLRGSPPRVTDTAPDYTPTVSTKVYRVEQPATTTIFSDEPPPLDQDESDDASQQEEDDDIFAELHRSKPDAHTSRKQSLVAQELFGGLREAKIGERVSNDLKSNKVKPQSTKQTSALFHEDSEPELFGGKPSNRDVRQDNTDTPSSDMEHVKKPIGGISVFGSNKGTESIGAAVLKRTQLKSSSDDDSPSAATTEKMPPRNTEKDIFSDLFATPKTKNKPSAKRDSNVVNKEMPKKVDLFTDNLFDDIDDIFTTNVEPISDSTKPQKSIFDDDNLFADITVTKKSNVIKSGEGSKSLFDSDDELFSEKIDKPSTNPLEKQTSDDINPPKEEKANDRKTSELNKNTNDIFGNYNVENEPFSKTVCEKVDSEQSTRDFVNRSGKLTENNKCSENIFKKDINDIKSKVPSKPNINEVNKDAQYSNKSIASNVSGISKSSKSIFDDNDSDSELFFISKSRHSTDIHQGSTYSTTQSVPNNSDKSIFNEDDSDAELFSKSNSKNHINNENNNNITNESISQSNNNITYNHRAKDEKAENGKSIQATVAKNNSISLFDDDNSSGDIFNKKPLIDNTKITLNNDKCYTSSQTNSKPSLHEDDDSDDLFTKSSKNEILSSGKFRKTNSEEVSTNYKNNESKNNLKSNSVLVTKEVVPSRYIDNTNKKRNSNEDSNKSSLVENHDSFQGSYNSNNNENQGSFVNKQSDNTYYENNQRVFKNVKEQQENIAKQIQNREISERDSEKLNVTMSVNNEDLFNESLDNSLLDALKSAPASNDIFSEILIEPPAFEKSKEPKKSKNVNALFDDDSDDEALFFKKNDTVLDENPESNIVNSKDALFGIFHDEPPAIDLDFQNKPKKANQPYISDCNKDLLKTTAVKKIVEENNLIKEELFKTDSLKETQTFIDKSINQEDSSLAQSYYNIKREVTETSRPDTSSKTHVVQSKSHHSNESLQQSIHEAQKNISKIVPDYDIPDDSDNTVGKLKNMNINIDVNSLLPGATLKKKSVEQIDGQVFSTKSQENLHSKYKIESTIVKSVSFDGEPDSQVLDNNISKQRAKIQVKRRPSSRRARKEAVRKSAIDVGDDSTDNSSSIDDITNHVEILEKDVIKDKYNTNVDNLVNKVESSGSNKVLSNKTEIDLINYEQIIDSKPDVINKNVPLPSIDTIHNNTNEQKQVTSTVKSKVVYVLNDEDIFSSAENARNNTKTHTSSDLFYTIATEEKPTISTLGSIYDKTKSTTDNKNTESMPKKSLFDDSSDDDELFNKPKNILNKPKSILDSDSDEDLFGGKGRKTEKFLKTAEEKNTKDIKSKVEVRGSLFGDDDDDEDLFGAKARRDSAMSKQQEKLPKSTASVGIKPVLEDPLSLLDSCDD